MISYNEILRVIKSFADGHKFDPRFYSEFREQLPNLATEEIIFPVIFVEPTNGDTLENTEVTEVNIYCLDRLRKDRKNTNDVLSDTKMILSQDLTRWLEEGQQDIEIERSYPCVPLNNYILDYTAGWSMRVRVRNERISICEVPVDSVPVPSPTCQDATAVLKNTLGNILSTTEIGSGDTQDIIAPDATIFINSVLYANVASGRNRSIDVYNSIFEQIGDIVGNDVIIPNSEITANGDALISLPATTALDVEVVDVNGDAVDTSIVSGKVQVNDLPIVPCFSYEGANFIIDPNNAYSWESPDTIAHSTIGFERFNLLNSVGFDTNMWMLDGINQYFQSQNVLLFTDRENALSFHMFVNSPSVSGATIQPFIVQSSFSSSTAFYCYRTNNDLVFRYYDGVGFVNTNYEDFFVGFDDTNMLMSLVVDYDTGNAHAYINGVLFDTLAHTAVKPTSGSTQRIGRTGGLYGEFNFGITGVWNKLHSATDVLNIFNLTKSEYGY